MNVFLVEDSVPIRERLVEIIEASGRDRVVGQADNYDDAIAGIDKVRPHVAIFDLKLAHGNGLEALAEAKRRTPKLVGIVMSNYATPQYKQASARAGAAHFLDKSSQFEQIPQILSQLAAKLPKESL